MIAAIRVDNKNYFRKIIFGIKATNFIYQQKILLQAHNPLSQDR
jgi:hypothetical protein